MIAKKFNGCKVYLKCSEVEEINFSANGSFILMLTNGTSVEAEQLIA